MASLPYKEKELSLVLRNLLYQLMDTYQKVLEILQNYIHIKQVFLFYSLRTSHFNSIFMIYEDISQLRCEPLYCLKKLRKWRIDNVVDCLHRLSKVLLPHLSHPLDFALCSNFSFLKASNNLRLNN